MILFKKNFRLYSPVQIAKYHISVKVEPFHVQKLEHWIAC